MLILKVIYYVSWPYKFLQFKTMHWFLIYNSGNSLKFSILYRFDMVVKNYYLWKSMT